MYYTAYNMKREILAVRLTPEELRLLDEARARLGVSRSEVVREAIARYAAQTRREAALSAAQRLAPWIGKHKGGDPGLSAQASSRLRKLLLAKHGRHSH